MDTESPVTPDVDLPGQQHEQADLDIVVEPEPTSEPEGAQGTDPASRATGEPGAAEDAVDDPEVGNTLIRPDNS